MLLKYKRKQCSLFLIITAISVLIIMSLSPINYSFWEKDAVTILYSKNSNNSTTPGNFPQKISFIIPCKNKLLQTETIINKDFYIIYNYIKAEKSFLCYESVTYSTIGDLRFLDNLEPIVVRWRGPVSVALYAPGDDFKIVAKSIAYLRNCKSPLIKKFITFHVFFNKNHAPSKYNQIYMEGFKNVSECSNHAPYKNIIKNQTYKNRNHLHFPINVARNIARNSVQTHFVLASDIELYPSPKIIPNFLQMVVNNPEMFESSKKNIFVLPVFEVVEKGGIPRNKTELQKMVQEKKAFWFHAKICSICHRIPQQAEWMKVEESKGLGVFSVGKRQGLYKVWEPFYIGTNNEPGFDERLVWEGQGNKMSNAYELCLLDYNFMVLNNAFLVHKPGITKSKSEKGRLFGDVMTKTSQLLQVISRELTLKYGKNDKCKIG